MRLRLYGHMVFVQVLKSLKFDFRNLQSLPLWSFIRFILFSCRWSIYSPVKRIISPQSKRCLNWWLLLHWTSSSKVGMLGTTSCRGWRKSCGFVVFTVTSSCCLHASVFLIPRTQKRSSEMSMFLKPFLFSEKVWWLLILLFWNYCSFSHTRSIQGRFHTRVSDLDPNAFSPVYTWY